MCPDILRLKPSLELIDGDQVNNHVLQLIIYMECNCVCIGIFLEYLSRVLHTGPPLPSSATF